MGLAELIGLVQSMSPAELASLARARRAMDSLEEALDALSDGIDTDGLGTLLTAYRQQLLGGDGLTDEHLVSLLRTMTAAQLAWLGEAAIALDELERAVDGLNGRLGREEVKEMLTAERWRLLGLLWDAGVVAGADEVLAEVMEMERIRPPDRP